jgi:hypothetical protein
MEIILWAAFIFILIDFVKDLIKYIKKEIGYHDKR